MKRLLWTAALAATALMGLPGSTAAQGFEAAGTRALGMAGAFVGVADDASAVYWNPAGLAAGSYFSLVADRCAAKALPDNDFRATSQSGTIVAVVTPALGLGYYRLRGTSLTPLPTALASQDRNLTTDGLVRLDTLITHHAGVTLVQSLTSGIAIGATLKLVRGIASSSIATGGDDREALLDRAADLVGQASTKFDADIGIMAALGGLHAGLTVRNLREPEFDAAGGGPAVRLPREARAGVSVRPAGILLAADVDLTRNPGPLGDERNVAAGAEARVLSRVYVRGGLRLNTIDTGVRGRNRIAAVGGSVAVTGSSFIDVQVTDGTGTGSRGWGIAGRVGF